MKGKPRDDYDTWWVTMQVFIEDQVEIFPKPERTIDLIGSLMDKYAAPWHIQWIKGTLNRTHPKSLTGFVDALKFRSKDREARDEAYADIEKSNLMHALWTCSLRCRCIMIKHL